MTTLCCQLIICRNFLLLLIINWQQFCSTRHWQWTDRMRGYFWFAREQRHHPAPPPWCEIIGQWIVIYFFFSLLWMKNEINAHSQHKTTEDKKAYSHWTESVQFQCQCDRGVMVKVHSKAVKKKQIQNKNVLLYINLALSTLFNGYFSLLYLFAPLTADQVAAHSTG